MEDSDFGVGLGGGAINEKVRMQRSHARMNGPKATGFDPLHHKSHLWHALEGMDRYPNYLSRWWSENDVDRLERALEHQLLQVREQRHQVQTQRVHVSERIQKLLEGSDEEAWSDVLRRPNTWEALRDRQLLHPNLERAILGSKRRTRKTAAPALEQVLSGIESIELDAALLSDLLEEEFTDVYSLPLLNVHFCDRLCDYIMAISNLHDLSESTDDPLSLPIGRRPLDLDSIGLSWLTNLLFHVVLRPTTKFLFHDESQGELDWRHAFVAGYSAQPSPGKPRERLVAHTDDSEVTLNLCLGRTGFQGGELQFRGLRGTPGDAGGRILGTLAPRPGHALLHVGRHFHDVTHVTHGDRFALIVWARSWTGIRSHSCPCCWLNRRTDDASCVCGPKWN